MRCPECKVHRANGHLLGCSTGAAGARSTEVYPPGRNRSLLSPSSRGSSTAGAGPAAPARTDYSSADVADAAAVERAHDDSVRVGASRLAPEDAPAPGEL